MSEFTLTIYGYPLPASSTSPVFSPAIAEPFADRPDAAREKLDEPMAGAERAPWSWRADEGARREALRRCGRAIQGHFAELAASNELRVIDLATS